MISNPKISVIIPIVNCEKYIQKCLQSLFTQTLCGFEVILVNDATPDKSFDIAKQFASDNKNSDKFRFELIELTQNSGPACARNHALDVASGEFVMFLDSDDYLKNNALQRIVETMSMNKLDSLYFNAHSFYETLTAHRYVREDYSKRHSIDGIFTGQELFSKMQEIDEFYPQCALQAFRREFLNENNIRFIEGIVHEDLSFFYKVAAVSKRAAFLNEEIYMRRVHLDSIMGQKKRSIKNVDGHFQALKVANEILKRDENLSASFKSALQSNMKKYAELCYRDWFRDISEVDRRNYFFQLSDGDKDLFNELILNCNVNLQGSSSKKTVGWVLSAPFKVFREIFLYLKEKK